MEIILGTLRDVDGVIGSFVLDAEGRPSARDLPRVIDDGALTDVGPRLGRLAEALEASGKALDGCAMRFGSHQLYLRRSGDGFLCVVARADCTAPALRMAAKLVSRRIGTVPSASIAAPSPTAVASEATTPSPTSPKGSAPAAIVEWAGAAEGPRPRFFRGRRID